MIHRTTVRSLLSLAIPLLLAACAAAPPPPVTTPPVEAAAPIVSVAGSWTWDCCAAEPGRYFGNLLLAQEGSTLRGVFVNDADNGDATYVEGRIEGRRVTFTRRWINADVKQPYSQLYTLELDAAGAALIGSFTEPHAPGAPIPMRYARGYKPVPPQRGERICGPAPRAASAPPAEAPPAETLPREMKDDLADKAGSKSAVSRAFKACPRGATFTCAPVSTGIPPRAGEERSDVCGCKTPCARADYLFVTAAQGQWPDGSQKAEFSCVHSGVPSTR